MLVTTSGAISAILQHYLIFFLFVSKMTFSSPDCIISLLSVFISNSIWTSSKAALNDFKVIQSKYSKCIYQFSE